MAQDIFNIISGETTIKNGTVVVITSPVLGSYKANDSNVVNVPVIGTIDELYTDRFDDTSYYCC